MKSVQPRQMPLDSRQLNAFVSLARTGSFKETAAELFLTHSAISHAMTALEREVGCRLLTRMNKRVVLTEMGEALLHHATHGLKEFAKAREALDNLKQWGAPRLRIGACPAVSRQLLPLVLCQARQEYPQLRITAQVVRSSEIFTHLADGELDIVLGEPQKLIPEITFTTLFESPLKVVVAPGHRWAAKGRIAPGELAKEPCLLTRKSDPTRQLIERYFFGEQIGLNTIAEIDSFDAIKELVKSGIGIGVLPQWVMQDELAAGTLMAFSPGRKALNQIWGLYRLRDRPISTVDNNFRIWCLSAAGKMIPTALISDAQAQMGGRPS